MVGAFDSVCHSIGEFTVGGLGSWFDSGSHSRAIADMEWLDGCLAARRGLEVTAMDAVSIGDLAMGGQYGACLVGNVLEDCMPGLCV